MINSSKPRLGIIIDGGLVAAVVCDHPELLDGFDVIVIDHDTEMADLEEELQMVNDDKARVYKVPVELPEFDINALTYDI